MENVQRLCLNLFASVQDPLFLFSSLRNFPEDRRERYRAANPKPGTEGWPRVSVAGRGAGRGAASVWQAGGSAVWARGLGSGSEEKCRCSGPDWAGTWGGPGPSTGRRSGRAGSGWVGDGVACPPLR